MEEQIEQPPYSLEQVKESFTYTAVQAKLFQPLQSFYRNLDLGWGNAQTAHASRQGNRRLITLGKPFFAKHVKTAAHAAHVLLHETLHHLFHHLDDIPRFRAQGYSDRVVNLAMDAIINAYLHSVGCAGFMEEFYPDRGEWAFLRPNSKVLRDWTNATEEERGAFFAGREGGRPYLFALSEFYRRLYSLEVTLEEALRFFSDNFPAPSGEPEFPLLGGQAAPDGELGTVDGDDGAESSDGSHQPGRSVFDGEEARQALEKIGLINAKIKRSFQRVIEKLTENAQKPGRMRVSREQSRRLPAKLNRRDLLNVARGRELFTRSQYRLKEACIFFDLSGSMTEYVPFIVGLMQSLSRAELHVRAICWADGAKEISYDELLRGELPAKSAIGIGTNGEAVAKFIAENRIKQAVIITDNYAGPIVTPIKARVHLCLVDQAAKSGSFIDPVRVPDCFIYELPLQ